MNTTKKDSSIKKIIERINTLELRMSKIESGIYIETLTVEEDSVTDMQELLDDIPDSAQIESKVGETGLAWLGNFVLFFGITFLVQYIQNAGHQVASSIFGFLSVAGIFTGSYFLKKTYPKMASLFNLNAWLLLFYVTLRLHFFADSPLVSNKSVGLILLCLVAGGYLYASIKAGSLFFTSISLVLFSVIAIVGDATHFMLPMSVLIAVISVLCLYRFNWIQLAYPAIVLSYLINFLWFLNNPFMGHQMQAIANHEFGFIYLFIIGVVFSLISLVKKSEAISAGPVIGTIIVNGMGFSVLLLFYILSFFKNDYVLMTASVSVFCLLYSILLKKRSDWKTPSALYVLYGFVTLSVALYGIYHFPKVYFLLALQSLLVVSMAVWFRSKFIVVMNTFLFITLLIFYVSTESPIDGVNVSFSIVALLTARILNWKNKRLTIKTLYLRNSYLIIAFIMVLITLNHMVPGKYVALSWTCAAVFYFIMSIILKNIKYRYMVLGTILAAAIHLFIVDLARIELAFRIIALIFLAIISIGLSIFYSKKRKEKSQ